MDPLHDRDTGDEAPEIRHPRQQPWSPREVHRCISRGFHRALTLRNEKICLDCRLTFSGEGL